MKAILITKHLCKNGVRIVHEAMPHARSVSLGIWVQAGSNDERQEEAGLAHFIEHMLFKGTKTETAKSIAEKFDQMGGELNAFTSKEATCFHTTVLTEDAQRAFELLADMFFNSTFEENEIMKEKSVILDEIAMCEDLPDDEVHEQLWKAMYPDHPIGRPVLGTKDSIRHFTKQSIDKFMNRLYRPERIVISIAGNYHESLVAHIEALFGSFNKSGLIEVPTTLELPVFHANAYLAEREIEQAHLCIGFPSITLHDPRQYELAIMDSVVGGAMSSRLFQEVREERGLGYAIYSYFTSYESGGAFMIYGSTAAEKLNELQETIFGVLKTAVEKGIGEDEINQAKQSVKSSFLLGLESVESRMTRNGHQSLFVKTHRTVDEVIEKIAQIDKTEVDRIIEETFTKQYASALIKPK